MEQRTLGRTGLRVSALGFGCGDVGGLIVRGTPAERERAVRRAIDAGVNYFDTASSYGNGVSEQNLGATLKAVGVRPYVGTKFRLEPADSDLAGAIGRSLDASLKRLAMDSVDLLQLHNLIVREDGAPAPGRGLTARRVLDEVVPALEGLRRQGKIRFFGITALGDTGGGAPGGRRRRVRYRPGVPESAEPERGGGHPRRVSGPGLRPLARPHAPAARGHHQHPRAGRRGAQRHRAAARALPCPRWRRSRPARTTRPTSSARTACNRSSTRGTRPT